MRNICALVALTMVVGCGGGDGKDGRDGAQGAMGAAGPPGANGDDGDNGEPGADGMNGEDGAPGTNGTNGTNGTDGADGGAILQGAGAPAAGLGVDGDIYIDTVSRDVYQKSNGTWAVITNLSGGPKGDPGDDGMDGTDGTDGASVLTGSGVPAAGLGKVGDVYIDSATGNLHTKGVGGWTVSGSLKGPAGDDGMDGQDGVDVKDTVGGVRWFAFALNSTFDDTPSLLTSQTHTDVNSSATFTFTGASQYGRLAFFTAGGFVQGGVNWVAFDSLEVTASVTGGAVADVTLYLTNGENLFCEWNTTTAAGPNYSFTLADPSNCENISAAASDFTLASVTSVQLGIRSSTAGARTLTVTDISLTPN